MKLFWAIFVYYIVQLCMKRIFSFQTFNIARWCSFRDGIKNMESEIEIDIYIYTMT